MTNNKPWLKQQQPKDNEEHISMRTKEHTNRKNILDKQFRSHVFMGERGGDARGSSMAWNHSS